MHPTFPAVFSATVVVCLCALQEVSGIDAPDLDTDDEKDEVEEYEAWREREMQRIARDR